MLTKAIRIETFTNVTEAQQWLYSSGKAGELILELSAKYELTEQNFKIFSVTVGDIILGFYKIEDTVPLLQQELELDAKTAALLGADVLDFLAPLSDPNWVPPVEAEEDLSVAVISNLQDTVLSDNPDTANVVPSQTHAEEHPESSIIPQLRTMATDMAEGRSPARSSFNAGAMLDEPVHTSTQPTLERKLSEAPAYTAPLYQQPKPNLDAPLEKPRWG